MDWPELDEALRMRKERKKKEMDEFRARNLITSLEKQVDEQFWVNSQLDTWTEILPAIDRLIEQWGKPVYQLLERLAKAYWEVDSETDRRLTVSVKLVPYGKKDPPEIYWEALYSRFYYMGWFTVRLVINRDGTPRHFCLEIKNGEQLTCPLHIEKLKGIMLQAFESGPLVDIHRKPVEGLVLKLDKGD